MTKKVKKILVLDAERPSSYAFVKALSEFNDIHITTASHLKWNICSFSKYSDEFIDYPDFNLDEDEFKNRLIEIIKKGNFFTVISFSDQTTEILSKNKDLLSKYTNIYQPDYEQIKSVINKKITYKIADECGVSVPKTYKYDINTIKDDYNNFSYPLVIKPAKKIEWVNGKTKYYKIVNENYIWNKDEFLDKFFSFYKKNKNFMLQEYIDGRGEGYFALIKNKEPLLQFAHQRIREYPVTGGASTYRKSINYEKLAEISKSMIEVLDWYGPIMFEYKYSSQRKKHYLMEINGRFWGSLPLAINNGLNYANGLMDLLENRQIQDINYKEGFTSRILFPNDFAWFLTKLSKLKLKESLQFLKKSNSEDILNIKDIQSYIGYIFSQGYNLKKIFKNF